ncbi:MAG: putative heme-binding domain-containing protein [Verrucomicrobiales bacterium]|jgi:putative heme-binding domain-containing protein
MKTKALLLFILGQSLAVAADDTLVRNSEPLSPAEELAALKVPDGFEIQLFAAEPDINKPINIAQDARGRMWVSSTVEYPYAAKKERWADPQGSRVSDSRDAIKILEDTDGDGKADKFTDFADGLNIPTGVLPWHKADHHDGCIAWSIPNIWYFADTTNDGKADHREVLFGPLGYEKDTHGMCSSFRMGRDGWVYATHGFNNTSKLKAKDGTQVELHSGNVFRFKPDGSSVEVWSHGQVNPFGLAFDHRGNLYSADCHSAPVYQLLQGGIYPSFGKPHDGLGFAPSMIEHTHGSTGICGITYIDHDRWGNDWNDHLLIGNPVTSRINHDRIEFRGTTPVAIEQSDFVVSKDPWFRPVDLHLGNDGSLYVADFYNRIIGHYEVPLTHPGRDRERGRIWKITKKIGSTAPAASPAFAVVSADQLSDKDPFIRRAAAHELQLQPDEKFLIPLLETLATTPADDTHLRHVLRMAIREHLKRFPGQLDTDPDFLADLIDIAPAVPTPQSAALLASSLAKDQHLTHIARYADDATLRKLISAIKNQGTPEDQLERIDALQIGLDERGQLDPRPELIAWAQDLAISLLAAKSKQIPGVWTTNLHPNHPQSESPWTLQPRQCTDGKQATVLSSLRIGEGNVEQRTGILRSKTFPAREQLSFWIVGHRGDPKQEPHEKNYVSLIDSKGTELQRAYPPRSDTAEIISWKIPSSKIGKPLQFQVVDGDSGDAYAWLGITRIEGSGNVTTDSFHRTRINDQLLAKLAERLKLSAPINLRDQLKPWLPEPSTAVALSPINEADRKALDALIAARISSYKTSTNHDPKNGAQIFKENCATCHQINGAGALLGPQLDGIGSRGIERLSEDILDPNRNVDSHFYLTQFKMKDASEISAFLIRESGASIHIRDLLGKQRHLRANDIGSHKIIPLSLMPANFGQTLSKEKFADLLAWLLDQS